MRVAIDTRKLHDFGIGTYVNNLVRGLARTDAQGNVVDATMRNFIGANIGDRPYFGRLRESKEDLVVVGPDISMAIATEVAETYRLRRPHLGVILLRRRMEVSTMSEALRAGIREVVLADDVEALVSACGSEWLLQFWNQLADHSERYRKIRLHGPLVARNVQAEHQALLSPQWPELLLQHGLQLSPMPHSAGQA